MVTETEDLCALIALQKLLACLISVVCAPLHAIFESYCRDMDCNDRSVHDFRLIEMEEAVSHGLVYQDGE
jgi:hypothetical protein